jgi:hypothetical protein
MDSRLEYAETELSSMLATLWTWSSGVQAWERELVDAQGMSQCSSVWTGMANRAK